MNKEKMSESKVMNSTRKEGRSYKMPQQRFKVNKNTCNYSATVANINYVITVHQSGVIASSIIRR